MLCEISPMQDINLLSHTIDDKILLNFILYLEFLIKFKSKVKSSFIFIFFCKILKALITSIPFYILGTFLLIYLEAFK